MIDTKLINTGTVLLYNDGRPGHTDVRATVLVLSPDAITVQFDDRADTTYIQFTDAEWMDHLTILDPLATMKAVEALLNAHPGIVASLEHPGFLDVQFTGRMWAFGEVNGFWAGYQTDLQNEPVEGTHTEAPELLDTSTDAQAIAAFIIKSVTL